MRGIAALSRARYNLKQMYPMTGAWGTLATTTPRKQENNEASAEGGGQVSNEKIYPVVAFSRPPPLPPFLGPLVALSLFDAWLSHNGDEDDDD